MARRFQKTLGDLYHVPPRRTEITAQKPNLRGDQDQVTVRAVLPTRGTV